MYILYCLGIKILKKKGTGDGYVKQKFFNRDLMTIKLWKTSELFIYEKKKKIRGSLKFILSLIF